jgi:hypothetical protein
LEEINDIKLFKELRKNEKERENFISDKKYFFEIPEKLDWKLEKFLKIILNNNKYSDFNIILRNNGVDNIFLVNKNIIAKYEYFKFNICDNDLIINEQFGVSSFQKIINLIYNIEIKLNKKDFDEILDILNFLILNDMLDGK